MAFDVKAPMNALGYRFIEASAGTGKTFTIEHLIARWVADGIPLNQILVVTFTKAATRELKERIYQRLYQESGKDKKIEEALKSFNEATITTIHGFCKAMLSKFFLEARVELDLSEEEESWKVWLEFLRSEECRLAAPAVELEEFFGDQFQKKFHELLKEPKQKDVPEGCKEKLIQAFHLYRAGKDTRKATPDDLMLAMKEAIKKEEFRSCVQKQFAAVVIDEFQDTDAVQWDIFFTLFCEKRILKAFCVVGDPKQSIYAFRNADLYTYFSAKEHFLPDEIGTLAVNYRSSLPLVSALNAIFTSFVPKGWMPLPKWGRAIEVAAVEAGLKNKESGDDEPALRVVIGGESEKSLYGHVAKSIQHWRGRGVVLKNIAVLVKDRYEARNLIQFLEEQGIKAHYTSRGQLSATAAFEAIYDFILLLERPHDLVRLKRVLAGVLSRWSIQDLQKAQFERPRLMLQRLLKTLNEKGLSSCLKQFFETPWCSEICIAEKLLEEDELETFEEVRQVMGLLTEKNEAREARLYLESVREEKAFGFEEMEKRGSLEDDAIQITTIFQSKGLEYEIVFPLGLATDRKQADEEQMAEKMRLLYVALTRAKRCIYLPYLRQTKEKAPSIVEQFFSLAGADFLDNLKQLAHTCLEEAEAPISRQEPPIVKEQMIAPPSVFKKSYAPRIWTSFSSLAKETPSPKPFSPLVLPGEPLPGTKTGKEVHSVLQAIFEESLHRPYNIEEIRKRTKKELLPLIEGVFDTPIAPLIEGKRPFTLKEVQKERLAPEMEFVFQNENDLMKGFIDLVFEHEGLYYIVDWKSNALGQYSQEEIEESMLEHDYYAQAKIYKEALRRYVKHFDQRPFEQLFGGAHYLYLRGMKWKSFLP